MKYVIGELQIKTTIGKFYNVPNRIAKSKTLTPPNAGEGVKQ
jgi:hypothetical protein